MPTSNLEAGSPIKPTIGDQTLVEYLETIELPPLPSPPPVLILDVLNAVYNAPPIVTETKKEPEKTTETKTDVLIVTPSEHCEEKALVKLNQREELLPPLSSKIGFKLALFSSVSAITGWIAVLTLMDEFGGILFLCCEFLALCFALGSIGHPPDKTETTTLRTIGFALSIGWLPILGLILVGWLPIMDIIFGFWPFAFILIIISAIWFLASLENEDSRNEILNIN